MGALLARGGVLRPRSCRYISQAPASAVPRASGASKLGFAKVPRDRMDGCITWNGVEKLAFSHRIHI